MSLGVMASSSGTTSQAGNIPASTDTGKQTYTKISTSEATNTLAVSPQKVFVLSYDAEMFVYAADESKIKNADNAVVKITDEPTGVLGLFRHRDQAKMVGKDWIYSQLEYIGEHRDLPLLPWGDGDYGSHEGTRPGTWRRGGDEHSGWQTYGENSEYYILDLGRRTGPNNDNVTLSVYIDEEDVDQDDEAYDTDAGDGAPEEGRAPAGIAGFQATAA